MFRENLKRLRREAGLTQGQVAEILGIERSSYTYYETGKSEPKFETLFTLAKIFNVSTDLLFDLKASQPDSLSVACDGDDAFTCADANTFSKVSECTSDERLLIAYSRALDDKAALLRCAQELLRKQQECDE